MNKPFFSVVIPQFNRTPHIKYALSVLAMQSFADFEVCISNDCSTDGRSQELEQHLHDLNLRYRYRLLEKNVRYDANLRTAIQMASGRFCLLMGNDDCLANANTMEQLHAAVMSHRNTGVVISNYKDYTDGTTYRRVKRTGPTGAGPNAAIAMFRNLSFVSGIVLNTDRAKAHFTAQWDGSEMYQMFLGCRIVAEGYQLVELDEVTVRMGIVIDGESVESYATRPREGGYSMRERKIPLVQLGKVVCGAIGPYCEPWISRASRQVFQQILMFTYPFWLVEYRRVQSWWFAAGVARGMRPANLLPKGVSAIDRLWIGACYSLMTLLGLSVPVGIFRALRHQLHSIAKSWSLSTQS